MRKLIILLLGLMPAFATAQTITAEQKQEALNTATQFCNLLTRFCNGERTTVRTQINALCSGSDCSAYDDIKTNKEIILRYYLDAITQDYPNKKLDTEISVPSLNNCQIFEEPVLELSTDWGEATEGEASTTVIASLNKKSIKNYFVVFNVTQKYPSLGKQTSKKIIYSVNSKKITAFITNQGSNISFLNGLSAYSNKDYTKAAQLFESAATNNSVERGSLKKTSYGLAMVSYIMIGNFTKAVECADKFGDAYYSAFVHFFERFFAEDWSNTNKYAIMMEKEMAKRNDMDNFSLANSYILLANFYVSPIVGNYQDVKKALQFFRKADALDYPVVGYMLFVNTTLEVFTDDDITFEEVKNSLYKSARLGYPPSFFWVGCIEENTGSKESAISWFKKSADVGNNVAMARLGRLLNLSGKKEEARNWLQKALEGNNLEKRLEDFELTTGKPDWPRDRNDVQTLLNSITTTYNSNNSSVNVSSSSYNNNSSYNNTTSYSNYSSYRNHRKFNEPKDEICAGWSIGYVQKQWVYDFDGETEKYGMFDDQDFVNGIQAGFRITPQFGYGFAMNLNSATL